MLAKPENFYVYVFQCGIVRMIYFHIIILPKVALGEDVYINSRRLYNFYNVYITRRLYNFMQP